MFPLVHHIDQSVHLNKKMKIESSNLISFSRGFTVEIIINRLITKMSKNVTRKLLDFVQEEF